MENNSEQLSENTENMQTESSRSSAETHGEEKAENAQEESKIDSEITEPTAKIKIEGQEFELESALAGDDKLLKTVLQPHFSSVENASITREIKNGRLHVTIVKKAQHKGR